MELLDGTLKLDTFLTVTLGIVVLFIGKQLNQVVPAFREFSIPEPVTGGLLVCILFTLIYAISGVGVEFNLGARNVLLVYFFTTIGINASFRDLLSMATPVDSAGCYRGIHDAAEQDRHRRRIGGGS